jgi:cytochrome c oxidase subunit 2
MARHFVSTALLWAAITAAGEALVFTNMFPTVGSSEAEDFDRIFRILLIAGIPVFAFVIAMLTYSVIMFRDSNRDATGPGFRGQGLIPKLWLGLTGALAIGVMIYPGLTGLAHLQSDKTGYGWGDTDAPLVIHVTGFRWAWQIDYAQYNIELIGRNQELVLPVNSSVRFNVDSSDVIHSFWIPAFRMKIDAIPGRTTFMTVKPIELGDYAGDDAYRVQCAELCGMDHASMTFPVRVVSQDEFRQWIADQQAKGK